MGKRWKHFEDFEIGDVRWTGSLTVERDEVIEFGRRYDPQPFHVDEEAASSSHFRGLVASGWHTTALTMRLMVESMQENGGESLGSPGVEEIRWQAPVRPGDCLRAKLEVVDLRELQTRPDRGLVKLKVSLRNQNEDEVMTMVSLGLFRRIKMTP